MQEAGQLEVGPPYAPGIRGWLAFFSIGVWGMPLLLAWSSIQGLLGFKQEFDKAAGRPLDLKMIGVLLQDLPESWDAALLFCLMVAIIALYGALIAISVWLITQWWKRKQHFPRDWIIFQMAILVIAIIVLVVTNEQQALQPRDVVASLANILFWWKSRRVAATLTQ